MSDEKPIASIVDWSPADISDIEFSMPACANHLIRGHRWWCSVCRREANRQFRDVCEALWRIRGGCTHRWHNLHGGGRVCSLCLDRRYRHNGSSSREDENDGE